MVDQVPAGLRYLRIWICSHLMSRLALGHCQCLRHPVTGQMEAYRVGTLHACQVSIARHQHSVYMFPGENQSPKYWLLSTATSYHSRCCNTVDTVEQVEKVCILGRYPFLRRWQSTRHKAMHCSGIISHVISAAEMPTKVRVYWTFFLPVFTYGCET